MMKYQLPKKIQEIIDDCSGKSKSLVLVTGVFDIFHFEHENFLKKASELGDFLIVGVESDYRVRQIKGEGRPVNHQDKRVKKVGDLESVSAAFVLPEKFDKSKDHIDLIEAVDSDILAVSSHTAHLDEKRKIMSDMGGRLVVVHDHNPEISSTKIIDKADSIKKKW